MHDSTSPLSIDESWSLVEDILIKHDSARVLDVIKLVHDFAYYRALEYAFDIIKKAIQKEIDNTPNATFPDWHRTIMFEKEKR
jgi:hypothetical protein